MYNITVFEKIQTLALFETKRPQTLLYLVNGSIAQFLLYLNFFQIQYAIAHIRWMPVQISSLTSLVLASNFWKQVNLAFLTKISQF